MPSVSACQDASMMFGDTPVVVQARSPSVKSTSTRTTEPVSDRPGVVALSSTRTLKSVRWMRASAS